MISSAFLNITQYFEMFSFLIYCYSRIAKYILILQAYDFKRKKSCLRAPKKVVFVSSRKLNHTICLFFKFDAKN